MSLRKFGNTMFFNPTAADGARTGGAKLISLAVEATLSAIEHKATEAGAELDWSTIELEIDHEEVESRTFVGVSDTWYNHYIRASILGVQ